MNWRIVKRTTFACVAIHTACALFVFAYTHFHQGAQDVMYWMYFFQSADDPLVTLGLTFDREILHFTAPFTNLWYELGFSGLNLRAAIIYLIFGGTQWAIWGFALGCGIAGIQERIREKKKGNAQPAA